MIRGPDALTMRRIAGILGIRAPSLHEHVPGKEALADAGQDLRRGPTCAAS